MSTKLLSLPDAIARFVIPGMHLHFASTPSRSNAAIRALCRRFRGKAPQFTLSSTGFHSTLHLPGRLRLGSRYMAAFYGDNYPAPRPNPLYARLRAEGVEIEHFTLHSYVTALRAGALGVGYGVTRSILGSSLEADLRERGRFFTVPDPRDASGRVGLVAAVRPDLTFIHVPAADERGNVIGSLPLSEGTWGALAAKQGVIVTAERIVDEAFIRRAAESVLLPSHRVVAVCPAPFGAHPQPLFSPRHLDLPSYADDFDAYELFREIGASDDAQKTLVDEAILGDDADERYSAHFDLGRRAPAMRSSKDPGIGSAAGVPEGEPSTSERLTVLAARTIADLVRTRGYRVILAGIGQAFFAVRLAALWLQREGIDVDVLVETGLTGIDCGPASGSFLLGFDVIARTRRLSSVDDVLGAIVCGAENRCLGVIGAGQIDIQGDVNSTLLEDGTPLVGSGGANDIASSAAELVVLTTCADNRFVARVPYVTSPGRAVKHIVTDLGTLCRDECAEPWRVQEAFDVPSDVDRGARLRRLCGWPLSPEAPLRSEALTVDERSLLHELRPQVGDRRRH